MKTLDNIGAGGGEKLPLSPVSPAVKTPAAPVLQARRAPLRRRPASKAKLSPESPKKVIPVAIKQVVTKKPLRRKVVRVAGIRRKRRTATRAQAPKSNGVSKSVPVAPISIIHRVGQFVTKTPSKIWETLQAARKEAIENHHEVYGNSHHNGHNGHNGFSKLNKLPPIVKVPTVRSVDTSSVVTPLTSITDTYVINHSARMQLERMRSTVAHPEREGCYAVGFPGTFGLVKDKHGRDPLIGGFMSRAFVHDWCCNHPERDPIELCPPDTGLGILLSNSCCWKDEWETLVIGMEPIQDPDYGKTVFAIGRMSTGHFELGILSAGEKSRIPLDRPCLFWQSAKKPKSSAESQFPA
ncbi:MAG: hypothetical protein WCQ60_00670 [bacterium]